MEASGREREALTQNGIHEEDPFQFVNRARLWRELAAAARYLIQMNRLTWAATGKQMGDIESERETHEQDLWR